MDHSVLRLFFIAPFIASLTSAAIADELIVTFVSEVTTFNGPFEISPFNPNGQLGGGVLVNPDLIKADGQFIVKDFDPTITGTQVFSFSPEDAPSDVGVEFFLHTPLLERVEAFTTRIGTNSPNDLAANTKILLPRTATSTTTDEDGLTTTGFFGSGSLTVVDGIPTSLTYMQGPDNLASFDFLFNPSSLEELTIEGSLFALEKTFDLDTPGAADDAPYGFNTILNGAPSSTVLMTTRGDIQAELDAPFAGGGIGNLLDGREANGGQPLSFNPLDGAGTLYHYTLTDAEMSTTAVVPEPSSFGIATIGFALLILRRRQS